MKNLNFRFKQQQADVVGIIKDHRHLKETLNDFEKNDFKRRDISLTEAKKSVAHKVPKANIFFESIMRGFIVGIIEGGILGIILSLNLIPIAGASTFITAGPFISMVAGVSIGANAGCISGALIGFFVNVKVARRYKSYIKDKGVIVSVQVTDPKKRLIAKNILVTNGATDIFTPRYS